MNSSNKSFQGKTWAQQQQQFKIGAGVFLLFLTLMLKPAGFSETTELAELKNRTVQSIEYYIRHGKGSTREIRVKLLGTMGVFSVSGANYDTFNHSDFKEEVKEGDIISIKIKKGSRDYIARSLVKNGKEYFNFKAEKNNYQRNRTWGIILTGYGFIFCLIPLFMEKEPSFHYGTLLLIGFMLCFLILAIFVN